MPFVTRTKKSREMGLQTYARAVRLMPELQDVELEYLSVRDYYMNALARLAQFEEALEQSKAKKNEADIAFFRAKVSSTQGALRAERTRLQSIAERSYAEAFLLVAEKMLPGETRLALALEAERLLGRPQRELEGG